jgi:EAL domain-containing protein (putative c-di-GMP-specific phosphodiesterase class I)
VDTSVRSQLISDLPGAAERGEIVAFYQPQIEIVHGSVVAAEALSRWFHPELGLVPPDVFIPLAEEIGAINEIGEFMMRSACAFAAGHGRDGHPIDIAVNVSAIQLGETDYASHVLEILRANDLEPNFLTIEVTESTAILDVLAVAERLDGLRAVGVSISVDDFGTGHSSVDQLLSLHATELKIDQSLVQDHASRARTLLGAVVAFAHDKGLRVVAEGVETAAQLAAVTALGCDRVQGYLVGKAMPAAEFQLLMASPRTP